MILATQQAEAVRACANTLKFLELEDATAYFSFGAIVRVHVSAESLLVVGDREAEDYPDVAALVKAYNLP